MYIVFIAAVFSIAQCIILFWFKKFYDHRARISRINLIADLHDGLSNTLTCIKTYCSIAVLQKNGNLHISEINKYASDAIVDVRRLIWLFDGENCTTESMINQIEKQALGICAAKNMRVQFKKPDTFSYGFNEMEKTNLIFMIREVISNSVKHSEAIAIFIMMSFKNGKPVIEIRDNGVGFDPSGLSEGHGLKNLRYRSGKIGYTVDVFSAKENGTKVIIQKR